METASRVRNGSGRGGSGSEDFSHVDARELRSQKNWGIDAILRPFLTSWWSRGSAISGMGYVKLHNQ